MKSTVDKQAKRDRLYMDIAKRVAQESYGIRGKVGAILVRDDHILAQGWNGMPEGMPNDCEDTVTETTQVTIAPPAPMLDSTLSMGIEENPEVSALLGDGWDIMGASQGEKGLTLELSRTKLVTKPEVLHAETNCLSKIMRNGGTTKGATMYVTLAPCIHCAKILKQAGIERVVYENTYRDTSGIDFLKRCNVKVEQLNGE